MDKITIQVMNGLDWERSGFIEAELKNTLGSQAIQLYSEQNEEVTAQLYFLPNNRVQVKFAAEHVPALGSKYYYLRVRDPQAPFAFPSEGLLDGNNYYLENDVVRIVSEISGTLTLMEKRPVLEDPTRFKVTAMGEELSEGSIWAGERFLSYPLLFQVFLNHQLAQIQEVHSVLQEAHDYIGHLHLSLKCHTSSLKDIIIETQIGLTKGINPTVVIHVDCFSPSETTVQFLFPLLPQNASPNTNSDINLVAVWDPESTRGLVFLSKSIQWELISKDSNSIPNQLLLTFQPNHNLSRKEWVHQKQDFAFLPLGTWKPSGNLPINLSIMRWIHEYFSQLQWHIEQ